MNDLDSNRHRSPSLRMVLAVTCALVAVVVWLIQRAANSAPAPDGAEMAAHDAGSHPLPSRHSMLAPPPTESEAERALVAADLCFFDGVVLRSIGERYLADLARDPGDAAPWWPDQMGMTEMWMTEEADQDADFGVSDAEAGVNLEDVAMALSAEFEEAGYDAFLDGCHAGLQDLSRLSPAENALDDDIRASAAVSAEMSEVLDDARDTAGVAGWQAEDVDQKSAGRLPLLVRQSRDALQRLLSATRKGWCSLPESLRSEEQGLMAADSAKRRLFYGLADATPMTESDRLSALAEWQRSIASADAVLVHRLDAPEGGVLAPTLSPFLAAFQSPVWSSTDRDPELFVVLDLSYRLTLPLRDELHQAIAEMRSRPNVAANASTSRPAPFGRPPQVNRRMPDRHTP